MLHIIGHFHQGGTVVLERELCGYCGMEDECTVELVPATKRGSFKHESTCAFFTTFNLGSLGIYKNPDGGYPKPATYPIKCSICDKTIWKYSLAAHVGSCHLACPWSQTLMSALGSVMPYERLREPVTATVGALEREGVPQQFVALTREILSHADGVLKAFRQFRGAHNAEARAYAAERELAQVQQSRPPQGGAAAAPVGGGQFMLQV
jgi:hypothetical protein